MRTAQIGPDPRLFMSERSERVQYFFQHEKKNFVSSSDHVILKSADSDPYHINFNFGTETSAGRKKKHQKANRGVGIIVAENNKSSQT